MAGYGNGAGPSGPVLVLDARSDVDERPYIVIKTDRYPDGERFYAPDIEDMDPLQIAQLQYQARRFDHLLETANAYSLDRDNLDPTAGAELKKAISDLIDMLLPDLPDEETRRRLKSVQRGVPVIQSFFEYLGNKLGIGAADEAPTPVPTATRGQRTGARSSRGSRASTPA